MTDPSSVGAKGAGVETFHWIDGGAQGRLAATYHRPEGAGPFPAILLCHGFTGTRVEPQQLFTAFSRRMARVGIASLRFDFGGHGESEGDFLGLTVSGELRDAQAAWSFLGGLPEVDPARRGLLGFSLGGYVAARSAPGFSASGLRALALWAGLDDLRRLKTHFLGLHGEERMLRGLPVDVAGGRLGPGFIADLASQGTGLPGAGWKGPVLLEHGERDQAVPPEAREAYRESFTESGASVEGSLIPEAHHLFDRAEARDRLYDETERFFLRHLRP